MLTLTYRYSPQELVDYVAQMFLGAIVQYFGHTKPHFTKGDLDMYFQSQFPKVWIHLTRGLGFGAEASDLTVTFYTSVRLAQDPKIKARMDLDALLDGDDASQMQDILRALLTKALDGASEAVDISACRSCALLDLAEKINIRIKELEG